MKRAIAMFLSLILLFSACPITVFADAADTSAAEQASASDAEAPITLYRYREKVFTGQPYQNTDSSWILYKTEPYSEYSKRELGYNSEYYILETYTSITAEYAQWIKASYSWDPNLTIETEYSRTGYIYNTKSDGSGSEVITDSQLIAYTNSSGRTYYEYSGEIYYYYLGSCDLYHILIYSEYYYHYYRWGSWSEWSEAPVEATDNLQVETQPGKRITYNANGGQGAPASILLGADESFMVSTDVPVREGHQFAGWSLSATGDAEYQPGDTCYVSITATLYAVWDFVGMISVDTLPHKTQYTIGENLDTTGLTVLLSSVDGSKTTITDGFTVTGFDSAALGYKTITVAYEGYTTTFVVSVVETGSCGGDVTWSYDGEGTLTVSGTGAMTNYASAADTPWYSRQTDITTVVLGTGVTRIGNYAFYGCTNLTSVSIPGNIIRIGNRAFACCEKLTDVTMENGITSIGQSAFYNCTGLKSIHTPDSVTTIESYAFENCSSLKEAIIGNDTTIRYRAFAGCGNLSSMTIPAVPSPFGELFGTGSYTGGRATEQEYQYGSSTRTTTYYIPSSLRSVTVTGGSIPYGAFYNCNLLTNITLGNNVTKIGDKAFYKCYNLTDISIGDNVTQIGSNAFYYCEDLTNITIGSGITGIGSYAFYYCYNLDNVYITDIKAWLAIDFSDSNSNPLNYADYLYLNNKLVTDLIVPDGVTEISAYALYSYNNLASVCIPGSVTTINAVAFFGCSDLISVIYCGTEEQWSNIVIGNYNTSLTQANRSYHKWKNATCTNPKTCTICSITEGDPLPHTFDSWTNTDGDQHMRTCTCGYVDAENHIWTNWEITSEATCTQNGEKYRTCPVCEVKDVQVIPSLGHSGDMWFEIITPSCTENGLKARVCDVCGETESVILAAHGHQFDSVEIAPTCTAQGQITNTCAICGTVIVEHIPAKGHKWSAWIQTKVPTCTTEGSQMHFCNCGTRETQAIAMKAHSYQNGLCTGCNKLESYYWMLSADAAVSLSLTEDLYIDLNGHDLSGTIVTNNFKIYGMDSTTNSYTCENIGYFKCVDENGNANVPVAHFKSDITGSAKRYMSIKDENGYSFHRFYLGITHMNLKPTVTGIGYKAVFYGDDMIKAQLDETTAFGYTLQLGNYTPKTISKDRDSFVSGKTITLRVNNFDVEAYGETLLYASVMLQLSDGTVIETAPVSITMRSMLETINANFTTFNADQLSAIKTMIEKYAIIKDWDTKNLFA